MELILVGAVVVVWFACVNVVIACAVAAGRADRRDERGRLPGRDVASCLAIGSDPRVPDVAGIADRRLHPTIR